MVNYYFLGLLALVCLYAWWQGGAPEKIGAAIFATGSVLTVALLIAAPQRFRSFEVGVLVIDTVGFIAFLILALCANRFWTLWVTGLLGVALVGHLAKLLSPNVLPLAYRVVLSIWSYPILALIAAGIWLHRRRVKRLGADKSWSSFCDRAGRWRRGDRPIA